MKEMNLNYSLLHVGCDRISQGEKTAKCLEIRQIQDWEKFSEKVAKLNKTFSCMY